MSVTYGFYNALNHDKLYNAEQVSSIFDGLISNGIYESIGTAMMVTPSSGMTVNVGIGRAWFNHTWTYNDNILPIELSPSIAIFSRIDAVVLKIDTRKSVRENTIEVIEGIPATNPTKPSIDSGHPEIYIYPLAYVTVGEGATEITASNIENRVGMSETPFVTGIIQVMSIDALIAQWNSEWQDWLSDKPAEFAAYIEEQKAAFDAWIAADKAEITAEHEAYTQYIADFEADMNSWKNTQESDFATWSQNRRSEFTSWESTQESDYATWSSTQRANFDAWFSNLVYVLDGDVAGHLQNEINDINNNWDSLETELRGAVESEIAESEEQLFNYYYELDNKTTTIADGVITEVSSKATAVTTFAEVAGGKDIVTVITPIEGDYKYTKTTQIRELSGGKTITESYTKELKEA